MRATGKKTGEGAASAVCTRNNFSILEATVNKQTTFEISMSGLAQYAGQPAYLTKGRDDRAGFCPRARARELKA